MKFNPYKFYRLDFSIRNLGISVLAITATVFYHGSPGILESIIPLMHLLLIQMNSFSMNDFYDFKVWDEENYSKKLFEKGFGKKKILFLTVLPLIITALTITQLKPVLLLLPTYFLLFLLYQHPSTRLKNNCYWSIFLNSVCLGTILFAYPYFYLTNTVTPVFIALTATFTLYLAFHEVVHQIAHMKKDRINSLPEKKGISYASTFGKVFLLISIIVNLIVFSLNPSQHAILIIPASFTVYRLLKLRGLQPKITNYQKIRSRWDKFYSFQEAGAFILFALLLVI